MATPTAMTAPAMVTTATRARRQGGEAGPVQAEGAQHRELRRVEHELAAQQLATIASAIRPASAAKIARAAASGRMARWVAPYSVAR